MKKKVFTTILWFLMFLIIAGGGYFLLHLYTQIKEPSQGILKIRYYPPQAQLKINQQIYRSPDGILSIPLDPDVYHLTLSAPGYSLWETDIDMAPQETKEIKPVYLFPHQWPQETLIEDKIEQFYPSPDFNRLLYITGPLKYNWCLYQRQNNHQECFWESKTLPQKVLVSPSFKKSLVEFKDNDWQIVFLPPSLVHTPYSLSLLLKKETIKQVAFSPGNENEIIIRTENGIFLFDFLNDSLDKIYQGQTSPFLIANNNLYLVASNGTLTMISLPSFQTENLFVFSFLNDDLEKIKIKKLEGEEIFVVINDRQQAYLFKKGQDLPQLQVNDVKDAIFSLSGENILFWGENRLTVFSLSREIKTEKELHSETMPLWFLNDEYILLSNEGLNIYNLISQGTWPLADKIKNHIYYYDSAVNYVFYLSSSGVIKISL